MKHVWTVIGVVVAIVALLWAVFIWFNPSPHPASNPSPPATARSEAATETPAPPPSTPTPQEVQAPPPPVMDHILVESGYSNESVPCCMVGKNLFKLSDSGHTSFGYHWSSRLSDGTENTSNACQILATVTGPENPPSLRVMDCTTHRSNTFSGYGNYASVSTPGEYLITVTDELSGATGSVTISVIP